MKTFAGHKTVYITVFLIFIGILAGCDQDDSISAGRMDEVVIFDDLRVGNITAESAVIRFTTSIASSCEVEYGFSEGSLDNTATDPMMGPDSLSTDHTVTLDGLTAETAHYYRARAVTESGTVYFSDVDTFTTLPDTVTAVYENIARAEAGTTVKSVSSNFGGGANDSAFGANNAIDGKISTEWSSFGDGDGAYIELDFGQMRDIARFGF
ncbi:fibronectin type III domain-containing protein [Candidatus Latescibacterota bacterium]